MKATVTIFGGTGDLTCRKLMPALYNLYVQGKLSEDSRIAGVGRRNYSSQDYREMIRGWIVKFARLKAEPEVLDSFLNHVDYIRMDFTQPDEYVHLKDYEDAHPDEDAVHLIYLAVAPGYFDVIADGVKKYSRSQNNRIILEKPFGDTLENARALNRKLEESFGSENLYRIDHYLGKEMVRNILAVRSTNPFFANVWDAQSIEQVEISALETVGVETRGGYYDASGAIRDMVQNHLFQILSITALDNPGGENLHEEQMKVLRSLRPIDEDNVRESIVLGQYEGYRQEDKVASDSNTETFARIRMNVDTPRWQGVPFYIRTGKKCSHQETSVILTMKPLRPDAERNRLVIRIQPSEEIQVEFNVKNPGEEEGLKKVALEYCQSCNDIFRLNTPESYERMLYACMNADAEWFTRFDQIEVSWTYVERMMKAYQKLQIPVYSYVQGTDGPEKAGNI